LRLAGRALAWHDAQMAATARVLRERLVSNDQAFQRVPGLDVVGF
jgi:predicted nucleic acid-binding protein